MPSTAAISRMQSPARPSRYAMAAKAINRALPFSAAFFAVILSGLFFGTSRWLSQGMAQTARSKITYGRVTNGFKLSISASKNRFQSSEAIMLTFRLKNAGSSAKRVTAQSPRREYSLSVANNSGVPVAPVETTPLGGWKSPPVILQPGEEQKAEMDLRRLYSLASGTYRITAKRQLERPERKGSITVVSNTFVIVIY